MGAGDDSGEEAHPDEPDSLRNHPLPHSILLQPVRPPAPAAAGPDCLLWPQWCAPLNLASTCQLSCHHSKNLVPFDTSFQSFTSHTSGVPAELSNDAMGQ